MSERLFEKVAIIGLGQMGASLGLALQQSGAVDIVSGYDLHPDHSSTALSIEAIDTLATSAEHAVENADLVILCTPVGTYGAIAQAIASHLKSDATLTDIGSIKAQAIRDISPHLPAHVHYVPSHPIAGSEQTGPYNAHADFFQNHLFLITPIDGTDESIVEPVAKLWHGIGAAVDLLPPDLHDQIYAYMSHLPQLMAFAAMPVLDAHHLHVRADDTLFSRFIRIGRSDPEMWRDVFLENADNVCYAAANVHSMLTHMRDELMLGGGEKKEASEDADMSLIGKTIWANMLASSMVVSVQLFEKQLDMPLIRYAAGGFTDVSAPATESPEDFFEAVSEHAGVCIELLNQYLEQHEHITQAIESRDADQLIGLLAVCQASGKRLITPLH